MVIRFGATGPGMRSGEARAARRGEPRRRGRALAERSGSGPAREGQTEPEVQVLQGISAEGQKKLGGAGVLVRQAANRAEINGARNGRSSKLATAFNAQGKGILSPAPAGSWARSVRVGERALGPTPESRPTCRRVSEPLAASPPGPDPGRPCGRS
jgi:hypothetical protein